MPQLVSRQRQEILTTPNLCVNSTGFQFIIASCASWRLFSTSVCMAWCLHIWPLTVYIPLMSMALRRHLRTSGLLYPAVSLSLGWTLILGHETSWLLRPIFGTVCWLICDSMHTVDRDICAEKKTVSVYVP